MHTRAVAVDPQEVKLDALEQQCKPETCAGGVYMGITSLLVSYFVIHAKNTAAYIEKNLQGKDAKGFCLTFIFLTQVIPSPPFNVVLSKACTCIFTFKHFLKIRNRGKQIRKSSDEVAIEDKVLIVKTQREKKQSNKMIRERWLFL